MTERHFIAWVEDLASALAGRSPVDLRHVPRAVDMRKLFARQPDPALAAEEVLRRVA